ncbi:hypothetical protein PBY51_018711 [Eleginops maclovinus]|uniref:Uncharacterized protein n=1 Tax=Eleginops maclovinus TaxID=56733 RepID=A0AAN7YEN3_ELEMC|nr:hypothetical protein PBY51_018711 [Eleginops maclovinus]
MKAQSCGVPRSSSRACRNDTRSRFGHLTSTVLMYEKETIDRIAISVAPWCGNFTAIRPMKFSEVPPWGLYALPKRTACPGALLSPASPQHLHPVCVCLM